MQKEVITQGYDMQYLSEIGKRRANQISAKGWYAGLW